MGSIAAVLPRPPSVPRDLGTLPREAAQADRAPESHRNSARQDSPADSIAAAIASHTSAPPAASSHVASARATSKDDARPSREAFAPKSPLPARATAPVGPPPPPGLRPMMTLGSLTPPPVHSSSPKDMPREMPKEQPKNTKSPKPSPVVSDTPKASSTSSRSRSHSESPEPPSYDRRRFPLPSMFASPVTAAAPKKHTTLWVACAVAGVIFAVWARSARQAPIPEPSPAASPAAQASSTPPSDTPPGAQSVADGEPSNPAASPVSKEEGTVEDLPVRKSDQLKKGQGLLEVVSGKSDSIYIDGKAMGSGPTVSVPLKARAEPYELKVKLRNEERVRSVAVKEGRITRVRLAPPWQR